MASCPSGLRRPHHHRRLVLAVCLTALVTLAGCDSAPPAQSVDWRALPSNPPAVTLQPYFPEVAKSHVGLSFAFDPGTGVTDPELLFTPTPEARWLFGYLGETPPTASTEPWHLPIPMSRRVPLRNSLLSVELWLAHVEGLYVADYVAAGRPGAKLRYSPWVEQFGLAQWKMGFAPVEPLAQPRLVVPDGQFVPTGATLDLALSSGGGTISFFLVVNDAGLPVGLTRDGRLYLDSVRRLSSLYGMLDGLQQAAVPEGAGALTATAGGTVTGLAGAEHKTPFGFGPVKIYRLPEAVVDGLTDNDGLYSLPAQPLPEPVAAFEISSVLQVGRREQTLWTPAWFYRNLRSVSECRALVHTALQRLDDALILDQTAQPPPRIVVKSDVAPFQKIFQDWAESQSGARRRPPIRFRHDKRMVLSRAFFNARKAAIRVEDDDILLDYPPPDPNTNRSATDQMAMLLSDCARYLRTRMQVTADNLVHVYEVVETVQVGAEKKPRPDRVPRLVNLDENTGAFEVLPMEKAFRNRVMPGNPNAIDAQGTVYIPNVNATDAIAEYRNLESEYRFITKALAVVQPELILEEPPPLVIPAKPADWTE